MASHSVQTHLLNIQPLFHYSVIFNYHSAISFINKHKKKKTVTIMASLQSLSKEYVLIINLEGPEQQCGRNLNTLCTVSLKISR
jgi:hypothetical protein